MSAILPSELHSFLGHTISDNSIWQYLADHGVGQPDTIKVYSDIVYYNFNTHGLSLQLKPERGYRPLKSQNVKREDLQENKMILSAIDIYCDKFKDFPLPLTHPLRQRTDSVAIDDSHLETTEITTTMTGEQLVDALGEPDRKGGGESKSIGVWLEWTGLGLMCEFGSIHGAGRWDKANGAGNAQVSVWTFFEPGQSMGQETEE